MKNKKNIIILAILIVLITGIFLVNNIYQNKAEVSKTKRKKLNNLAIMIKEDSATDYTKSSSKDIPKGDYVLNRDKSYCKNNGVIGDYDSSLGKVSFSFIGSDSCFLYFDYEVPSVNILGVKIPLDTELDSSGTSSTKYIVSNENGLRYEGADPNNYICLDNKTSGACSNTSLLFRIIGLFDEEYSTDGTTSAGTKKLLKILDTNNYGGTSGKEWDDETATTSSVSNNSNNNINIKVNLLKTKYKIKMLAEPTTCFNCSNNWSSSSLKKELNESYLTTLLEISGVNSKLENAIVSSKWHLGGANGTSGSSYYSQTITTENYYKAERSPYATSGTLKNLYNGNPEYVFAKVGLMYPSDYGYATIGGSTTNKAGCRAKELYNWDSSSYSDCKNNDWLFNSATFVNSYEWFISPIVSYSYGAAHLYLAGYLSANPNGVGNGQFAVRPTFYLDANAIKIVGGSGISTDPYYIG